jgi:hypothetical protein
MSERLRIDPEVLALLGITEKRLAKMKLDEFAELVWDKGYRIRVGDMEVAGDRGGLTITTARNRANCGTAQNSLTPDREGDA